MEKHLSKSHVLAGVQDAYWSDEELEEAECPLCLEEMDLSDMGFKPCPCGYQICQFCWHHIKQNLNGRCPACRREYSEDTVEFTPVKQEDIRRLNQQKKTKEKERKELEAIGRKSQTNIRVVQRNVVYITGVGPRFAREELIPTLRSQEYFGQYGKISKILLVKRTSPSGGKPVVGLYVTYHKREDASRAIAAVDGTPSPSGGGEITRASYGTTKYCIAFLRGTGCSTKGCLDLHEWGDERDCFTKEDLSTLKHAMKDTELNGKKSQEDAPRRSAWSNGIGKSTSAAQSSSKTTTATSNSSRSKTSRDTSSITRPSKASRSSTTVDVPSRKEKDRDRDRDKVKKLPTGSSSQSISHIKKRSHSTSRPASPAVAALFGRVATPFADSDRASPVADVPASPATSSNIAELPSKDITADKIHSSTFVPDAPPGLSTPSSALASSYQPSTAAQALLDDVRLRRHQSFLDNPSSKLQSQNHISPFPDFDRTLRNLGLSAENKDGDGGLKFSFDFEVNDSAEASALSSEDVNFGLGSPPGLFNEPTLGFSNNATSYSGSFNPFESSQTTPPSSTTSWPRFNGYPSSFLSNDAGNPSPIAPESPYRGTFDPFADVVQQSPRMTPGSSLKHLADADRPTSRFEFARKSTAASVMASQTIAESNHSSPMISSPADALPASPFMSQADLISPKPAIHTSSSWAPPLARADSVQSGPPPGLSPATTSISLTQLFGKSFVARRDSLKSTSEAPLAPPPGLGLHSQARIDTIPRGLVQSKIGGLAIGTQGFVDPAIMSTRVATSSSTALVDNDGPIPGRTSTATSFSPSQDPQSAVDSFSIYSVGLSTDEAVQSRMTSHSRGHNSIGNSFNEQSMPTSPLQAASQSNLSAPQSPQTDDVSPHLQSMDFPALPSSNGANEPVPKVRKSQPHIQSPPIRKAPEPKIPEPKIAEPKTVIPKSDKQGETARKKSVSVSAAGAKSTTQPLEEKKKGWKTSTKEPSLPVQAPPKVTPAPPVERATNAAIAAAIVPAKPKSQDPPIARATTVKQPVLEAQAPLLSRQSKKEKKIKPKPPKINKSPLEDPRDTSNSPEAKPPAVEQGSATKINAVAEVETSKQPSRSKSVDPSKPVTRTTIAELLRVIDSQMRQGLTDLAFFNSDNISPKTQTPLQYAPLVHALSALSVGGGTFSNSLPSRSIDTAVSSFQTLLETLTQTISDLLRLLPRTTWDDSSSFDGVLRDMLKGDDFFDEPNKDAVVKEDEVAALTQALERRARWMEIQLSKLEELHRDINTAAVRAVLSFNDRGWDRGGFLPKAHGSLKRFDDIIRKDNKGNAQNTSVTDLERRLEKAQDSERIAEQDVRKSVEAMSMLRYKALDDWSP